MEIKGKTAIITGATGKLSTEIVLSLAKAGANCICIYHKNKAQADKLRAELDKLKIKNLFIRADLTKNEGIEKVFTEIKKFSPPQILINAAAVFEKKLLKDVSFEYINETLDMNFAAAMIMTQKFVELVRKKVIRLRRGFGGQEQKQNLSSTANGKPIGKIINITDIAAQRPPAGFSVYCASKAAVITATKSLAKELAPDWTVNAVSPGMIHWYENMTAEQKKKIIAHIPAGRTGRPDEVAAAVKFLIENDYMTGQIINIDGGKDL